MLLALFPVLLLAAPPQARAQIPAVHGAIVVTSPGEVIEGTAPVLTLSVKDRDAVFWVSCTVGEAQQTWTTEVVPAGGPATFELPAPAKATTAACELVARFGNGLSERRAETVTWTWKPAPQPPPAEDEDVDAAPPTPADGGAEPTEGSAPQ